MRQLLIPSLVLELKSQMDFDSTYDFKIKQGILKTLPYFLGYFEHEFEAHKIPSQKPATQGLIMTNLANLLSMPAQCSLPLDDILKVKPKLQNDVWECPKNMGINMPRELSKLPKEEIKSHKDPLVPQSKVKEYCEGEDGNTTLLVEQNVRKHIAILDSRADIAIATKSNWDSWGKLAQR